MAVFSLLIYWFFHNPITHKENCFTAVSISASEFFPEDIFSGSNSYLTSPSISSFEGFSNIDGYESRGYAGVMLARTRGRNAVLLKENDTITLTGEITFTEMSNFQKLFNPSNYVGKYLTVIYGGKKYLALSLDTSRKVNSLVRQSNCFSGNG